MFDYSVWKLLPISLFVQGRIKQKVSIILMRHALWEEYFEELQTLL